MDIFRNLTIEKFIAKQIVFRLTVLLRIAITIKTIPDLQYVYYIIQDKTRRKKNVMLVFALHLVFYYSVLPCSTFRNWNNYLNISGRVGISCPC